MIKYEDMGRIDRDWWRYDANKAGGLGSSIYNAKQKVYIFLSISLPHYSVQRAQQAKQLGTELFSFLFSLLFNYLIMGR